MLPSSVWWGICLQKTERQCKAQLRTPINLLSCHFRLHCIPSEENIPSSPSTVELGYLMSKANLLRSIDIGGCNQLTDLVFFDSWRWQFWLIKNVIEASRSSWNKNYLLLTLIANWPFGQRILIRALESLYSRPPVLLVWIPLLFLW